MNLEGKIDLIKQAVQAIKTAILGKGQTPSGNLSTYANAIDNIVTPNNQNKTVTQNGSVTFDNGYTGLGTVTVNVNQSVQNKTITDNGSYTADSGYVGLGTVSVNVSPDIDSKTITANGTYNASDDDLDGYSSVTVNVPIPKMNYWEDVNGIYHVYEIMDEWQGGQPTTPTGMLPLSEKTLSTYIYPIWGQNIKVANLLSLEEIQVKIGGIFANTNTLLSANFLSLKKIDFPLALHHVFYGSYIKTLYFPSLTSTSFGSYTNQFERMLDGGVIGCTVHFPSNLQAVIGNWADVQNGFGGINTTVLFDLPATT